MDPRPPTTPASRDDLLSTVRASGEHPLMTCFPRGAVLTFDTDLRLLSAGGTGLPDVGLSRPAVDGCHVSELYPTDVVDGVTQRYRATLDGETGSHDVELGGRTYCHRFAPVRDATGAVVAGLALAEDVTEERARERALKDSEEHIRLTFEHAPIGKAIVELDGRWRRVNAAVVELLGYPEDELTAMTFQDVTHPDDLDLDLDHLRRLVAGEIGSYQIEKRYFTARSRVVWVLLSVALVRDEDRHPLYFVAQIQDITERTRQRQALEDLTAMLAHDLRAPTTIVNGFAEALIGSWDDLADDERLDYLRRIAEAGRGIQSLLENSLTTVTLDSGRLEARPADVVLRDVVASCATVLDRRSVVDVSGLGGQSAWVDGTQLRQVLDNLMGNAVKYGGGAVSVTSRRTGPTVELTVRDDGPGVEPDFVPHLFDRYSRAHAARTGGQRGTGLGLYIARDLVRLNGGTIVYRPAPGGGAEFVVTLPGGPSADDGPKVPRSEAARPSSQPDGVGRLGA